MNLEISVKVVGFNQTNCWMLKSQSSCILIDPGARPKILWQWLQEQKVKLELMLFTHSHLDHIGGAYYLQKKTRASCRLHPLELENRWKWLGFSRAKFTPIQEGEIISFAGAEIQVLHTPGHSPGSVCYYFDQYLFCGDLLFAGGVGRWDMPGGSFRKLVHSLKEKLRQFPDSVQVFPGHGPATTLGEERRINPLLGKYE